jgi:16S rRNA processing protein RimM
MLSKRPGSPEKGEPVYISIGKIRRPHGVKGEMLMQVDTDLPEKIRPDLEVFVGTKKQPYKIKGVRNTASALLISFQSITNPETAGLLRNQLVFIKVPEIRELPDGRYYQHEVIGMSVVDEQGSDIGVIMEILVTGANDVYVVKQDSGDEILLPAIKTVIRDIDIEKKRMIVCLPEWE